ncbi:MAG: hypothetical protein ACKOKC_06120, partial [Chthoniobacterales bacterium]
MPCGVILPVDMPRNPRRPKPQKSRKSAPPRRGKKPQTAEKSIPGPRQSPPGTGDQGLASKVLALVKKRRQAPPSLPQLAAALNIKPGAAAETLAKT